MLDGRIIMGIYNKEEVINNYSWELGESQHSESSG
jgi:hypothetical protein